TASHARLRAPLGSLRGEHAGTRELRNHQARELLACVPGGGGIDGLGGPRPEHLTLYRRAPDIDLIANDPLILDISGLIDLVVVGVVGVPPAAEAGHRHGSDVTGHVVPAPLRREPVNDEHAIVA